MVVELYTVVENDSMLGKEPVCIWIDIFLSMGVSSINDSII